VPNAGLEALQKGGALIPQIPPDPTVGEESRRNRAAFDFIVMNKLYSISGLKETFGKEISFPVDAIEIKANWKPVESIPGFTNNRVSLADVPRVFHVNTGADGKQYAMVSMHVISKLVPNWTWATFEHTLNPGRCDILGCIDRDMAKAVSDRTLMSILDDRANHPHGNLISMRNTWESIPIVSLAEKFTGGTLAIQQTRQMPNGVKASPFGENNLERSGRMSVSQISQSPRSPRC
jgi:hypothetical protein